MVQGFLLFKRDLFSGLHKRHLQYIMSFISRFDFKTTF